MSFRNVAVILLVFLVGSCGVEPSAESNSSNQRSTSPKDENSKNKPDSFDALPEDDQTNDTSSEDQSPSEEDGNDDTPEIPTEPVEPVQPEEPVEGISLIDGLQIMSESTQDKFYSKDHPYGIFVVEAYFLTCPYCNQNAGRVKQLAQDYENQSNVHVLDVSTDCRRSDYRQWISKHSPEHLVLNDCGGRSLLRSELGVTVYPTTVVIDCKGKELYRAKGLWSSSKVGEIKDAIDSAVEYCKP